METTRKEQLTAIDLYSGVGGWSLGAQFADVKVSHAYEWWETAAETYRANLGDAAITTDIRELQLSELPNPGAVQIVFGSPPCTEFSFANRGGNGNLADGLLDVEKFLEIVRHLKPQYWAMENVPRLAGIVSTEIGKSGKLARFRDLVEVNEVFLMSDYGIPQRRSRCILGKFPVDTLRSYKGVYKAASLGDIIKGLTCPNPRDPVYDVTTGPTEISNQVVEAFLTEEEERLNRAAKCYHPVYNLMSFPDSLDKVSRTITATNTRVSRESIIVGDSHCYRRLTLREQASIQTFPAGFQFAGTTYSQLQRMIGNAVPPLFTYQILMSMKGASPEGLEPFCSLGKRFQGPDSPFPSIMPDSRSGTLRPNRNFRFAIPHLRFGSGIRFELCNEFVVSCGFWRVRFFYGTSRNIIEGDCDMGRLRDVLGKAGGMAFLNHASASTSELNRILQQLKAEDLQSVWTKQRVGYSPLELLDELGKCARHLLDSTVSRDRSFAKSAASELFPGLNRGVLQERSFEIVVGAFLAALFRSHLNLSGTLERPRLNPLPPQQPAVVLT